MEMSLALTHAPHEQCQHIKEKFTAHKLKCMYSQSKSAGGADHLGQIQRLKKSQQVWLKA